MTNMKSRTFEQKIVPFDRIGNSGSYLLLLKDKLFEQIDYLRGLTKLLRN